MKKILFLAFANCLALLGCMTDNTSPETPGTVGSAQIRFPTVPAAALKAAAKTTTSPTSHPMPIDPITFTITIEGPGMATRTQTWDANAVSGKTITLENIPSGPGRIFHGILTQYNMTTHEGSYSVDIGGGQSVFVPLVLRDVRNGRAEICVEVEGWSGPDCVPIDTLPDDTLNINGCWKFSAFNKDSSLAGELNLSQYGRSVSGTYMDPEGRSYQVMGGYKDHAWELTMTEPRFEINYMIPMPDTMTGIKRMPPIDTGWTWPVQPSWPAIYVKVETIQSLVFSVNSGYFTGSVTDSTFRTRLGDASAVEVGCPTEPWPPIDPPIVPIDTNVYLDGMHAPRR